MSKTVTKKKSKFFENSAMCKHHNKIYPADGGKLPTGKFHGLTSTLANSF